MHTLSHHQDFLYLRFANVFIALVRGEPSRSMIDGMHANMVAMRSDCPRGVGFLLIKLPGAPIPHGAIRKRAQHLFHDLRNDLRGFAGVSEGSGFWASTTRAAMMTITLFGRRPYPMKIFGNVEDGARWLLDVFSLCPTPNSWVAFQTTLGERREAWIAASPK